MDKGGEVCGDMEDAARELSTYNHYTCSYNGKWIGEEPAKCGSMLNRISGKPVLGVCGRCTL